MAVASNFLVNFLVAKGGSALVGKTETGQPFYHGDVERLFRVESVSGSINDEDLGEVISPRRTIEFGDGVPFIKPVLKLGTLWIPFGQDLVIDSV